MTVYRLWSMQYVFCEGLLDNVFRCLSWIKMMSTFIFNSWLWKKKVSFGCTLKCEKIFHRMMRNLFIVAVNTVLRSLLDIQIPKYDRRIESARRQPVLIPNITHFKILWLHKRTTNSSCCLLSPIILSSQKTPTLLTLSKLIVGGSCKGFCDFSTSTIY